MTNDAILTEVHKETSRVESGGTTKDRLENNVTNSIHHQAETKSHTNIIEHSEPRNEQCQGLKVSNGKSETPQIKSR